MTEAPNRERFWDWLADNALAAVSVVGAFVYGVTRISYVGFYGEFGLDPEDVGIGYAGTLTRALPGLLVWPAVFGAVVWVFMRPYAKVAWKDRPGAKSAALVALPFTMVVLVVLAPLEAQRRAAAVKDGEELRAPSGLVSWGIWRNSLGFTVREVEVEWVDGMSSDHAELGTPLMLLGADSNVYYVFAVESQRTVRLPRGLGRRPRRYRLTRSGRSPAAENGVGAVARLIARAPLFCSAFHPRTLC